MDHAFMRACVAFFLAASSAFAQTSIDADNRYPTVGAITVWRMEGERPVELRGCASGALIRDRVMITAGHFTAPAKALGTLPPDLRFFASFSAEDAKNPETWIPVVALTTHPSMPHCPPDFARMRGRWERWPPCGHVVPLVTPALLR